MRFLGIVSLLLLASTLVIAGEKRASHFGYGPQDGPAIWSTLNEHYSECGQGKKQSPIDLTDPRAAGKAPASMSYEPTALNIAHHEHVEDILNNGHTIQVNYDEKSMFKVGDKTYELKQFHFHTPSEHTVNGMHYPMEMHMVHANDAGELAVFGIFFVRGKHNAAFSHIVGNLPSTPGEKKHVEHVKVDLDDMLPANRECYSYSGSLTTPPCSEGVSWFVAMKPVEMSAEQIEAFTCRLRQNNRPPQPLNGRTVAKTSVQ